jgi:hypothetical protein
MPELLSKIDAVYGNANRTAEVPMPLKNWIVTDNHTTRAYPNLSAGSDRLRGVFWHIRLESSVF